MILKLLFVVSFSDSFIYIYICIIMRDNVAYEGFGVLDYFKKALI